MGQDWEMGQDTGEMVRMQRMGEGDRMTSCGAE